MKQVTCSWCGNEQDGDQFSWRNKKKGIRLRNCKTCQNKYSGGHYRENSTARKQQVGARKKAYRARIYMILRDYFSLHPCACGQAHPAALEFHHIDPKKKHRGISMMISRQEPLERIMREIEKCVVMCANCHRIATAEEQGWYKHVPVA